MIARAGRGVRRGRTAFMVVVGLIALALWWVPRHPADRAGAPNHLTRLAPNGASEGDVQLQVWQQAAAEVGFPLQLLGARLMPVHDAGVATMDGRDHPRQSRLSLPAGSAAKGPLHWTTMAQHAEFSNRRLRAQWRVEADQGPGASPGGIRPQVRHPKLLDRPSGLLPADRYTQPQVLEGQAQVVRDGPCWRIAAGPTLHLAVGTALLRADGTSQPEARAL